MKWYTHVLVSQGSSTLVDTDWIHTTKPIRNMDFVFVLLTIFPLVKTWIILRKPLKDDLVHWTRFWFFYTQWYILETWVGCWIPLFGTLKIAAIPILYTRVGTDTCFFNYRRNVRKCYRYIVKHPLGASFVHYTRTLITMCVQRLL